MLRKSKANILTKKNIIKMNIRERRNKTEKKKTETLNPKMKIRGKRTNFISRKFCRCWKKKQMQISLI